MHINLSILSEANISCENLVCEELDDKGALA